MGHKVCNCTTHDAGNVSTYLEAVASPVIQAWKIPLKKVSGLRRVMMKKLSESVTTAWKRRPTITVNMYMPSDVPVFFRSSILMILPAIRHSKPNGAYLRGKRYFVYDDIDIVDIKLVKSLISYVLQQNQIHLRTLLLSLTMLTSIWR